MREDLPLPLVCFCFFYLQNKRGQDPMPSKPQRPCRKPGCPNLALPGKIYCKTHNKLNWEKDHDKTAYQRGYTGRWQMASRAYLHAHPLCEECKRHGRLTAATVVDHITPHRGDKTLFWDESNWQALCKSCHDEKTGREDRWIQYGYGKG
jgi:5-methylcytosine-specific restriction protein A